MSIRKFLYVALSQLTAQIVLAANALAQQTLLNVGYSATSSDPLPARVAKDSGIFAISRYGRAHVDAVARMWNDKEASIKALARHMGSSIDRETLGKTRADVMHETLYTKKQYPSAAGLKTVIDERDARAKISNRKDSSTRRSSVS